ncbi:MAG: hypothetical protein HYU36_02760 [Planctomycetes bacterium]|nr:hypothetical protein [Planctomycetota bacterium]
MPSASILYPSVPQGINRRSEELPRFLADSLTGHQAGHQKGLTCRHQRQRALGVFLPALFLTTLHPCVSEVLIPEGFHVPQQGMASRLVTDRAVYLGHQQVWLHLDAFNGTENPVELAMGYALWPMLKVTTDEGREVEIQNHPPSGLVTKLLSPGKITLAMSFFVSGNEHAMFGQLPPGRYRAMWEGQAPEEPSQPRYAPASNPVDFEIKEASQCPPDEGIDPAPIEAGPESQGLRSLLFADRKQFLAGSLLRLFLQAAMRPNKTSPATSHPSPSAPSCLSTIWKADARARSTCKTTS